MGWSGIPIQVGSVTLGFSFYPPVAIAALIAFWLGPGFGAITAYVSTFASGIVGGLSFTRAALFALGTPAEILLLWFFSVVLRLRPNLAGWRDWWRYLAAALIAATASSVDIMLYNEAHRVELQEGQRLWLGWILGDVAQLALIVGPLLVWLWQEGHAWAFVRLASSPRHELSTGRTVLLLAFVWMTLGGLAFAGVRLLNRALDIPGYALTPSGELLALRLREMGLFVFVFAGALLVSTMALTAALAGAGERNLERSLRDELTGTFNRRAFARFFAREAERCSSLGLPMSLAYFDADRFKKINDQFGHAVGDSVLVSMTRQAQKVLRPQDLLFRFGGEEFVILLSHTSREGAVAIAEQLRADIERNVATPGKFGPEPVTVSIGVASVSPPDLSQDRLLEAADRALYRAKAGGRNRVVADVEGGLLSEKLRVD